MTMTEHNLRCDLIKMLYAALSGCGTVRIEPGVETIFQNGFVQVKQCWWFYMDNPQTSMSFWTLEELERHVMRTVHAYKLLQVTTPTSEQRKAKTALKQMCGNFTEAEKN